MELAKAITVSMLVTVHVSVAAVVVNSRYYLKSDGNVDVKMVNATMEYSFEYLGNPPKLVRTTLTEKCFLALTQV